MAGGPEKVSGTCYESIKERAVRKPLLKRLSPYHYMLEFVKEKFKIL
jgi:hypothetical protein